MEERNYEQIKEKVYHQTLPNGLEVFLLPKQEMAKTFGVFTTKYGSIDQSFTPLGASEQVTVPDGIAHFLEHKLFEKEDRDVFQDFTEQGASANAFTSFDRTAYLFSATSQIQKNVNTLLNFVQDPYFSDQSVEKEKGIIAQEIQMYDDQPDWRAFFGTIESLYQNHPVKIDIAGTVDSINKITKEDLYTCYRTFYHPSNMVFFLAGRFDPDEMMTLIKENQITKHFPEKTSIDRFYPNEPDAVAKEKHVIKMPVSMSKCMVGIKENMKQINPEQFLKRELLTQMLLDYYFSKSGEFYEELYQDNLIDDSFHFENNLESNFGFTILGGNTPEPDKLADKIKEMLNRLVTETISEEQFERMKKKKIGQFVRSLNSLEFISNQFVRYHHLNIDLFTILPTIEKLEKGDLDQHITNWIKKDNIAVCQIVPSS